MKVDHADIVLELTEEADGWFVEAIWQGHRIGHAYCSLIENAEVQLCDLVVDIDVPVLNSFMKKLCRAFGRAYPGEGFRGNSVGSLILDRIIMESKIKGLGIIWGSIVQADIDQSPFLLEWYERHGFSIMPPDRNCLPNAVKKIQYGSIESPM